MAQIKKFYYLLNNSIPLIGVFIFGWDSLFFVQFCFIETFLASLFDFVKFPFLKEDPNGDPNQTGFVTLSFVLLPMLFLYAALLTSVLEVKILPWENLFLPAICLITSYTVQFFHFMIFERDNSNFYRNDLAQFMVLRDIILMGAIILLPWVAMILFYAIFQFIDIHLNLSDAYKTIIILMLVIRTYFEIKLTKDQNNRRLASLRDL